MNEPRPPLLVAVHPSSKIRTCVQSALDRLREQAREVECKCKRGACTAARKSDSRLRRFTRFALIRIYADPRLYGSPHIRIPAYTDPYIHAYSLCKSAHVKTDPATTHTAVVIIGRGKSVAKAVTIVEIIKRKANTDKGHANDMNTDAKETEDKGRGKQTKDESGDDGHGPHFTVVQTTRIGREDATHSDTDVDSAHFRATRRAASTVSRITPTIRMELRASVEDVDTNAHNVTTIMRVASSTAIET